MQSTRGMELLELKIIWSSEEQSIATEAATVK